MAKPSVTVPTIREMLIMIARLGGYLNRKNDSKTVSKVILRGFAYLRTFMDAWKILEQVKNTQESISVKKSYE